MRKGKIKNLSDYIEALYDEDIKVKVAGCEKLVQLAHSFDNLQDMLEESSILSTIIRTLNQEYPKNMDLCIYLLCFIYILAHYNEFHELLVEEQVGSTTTQILNYHLNRFDTRFVEYLEFRRQGKPEAEKKLQHLNSLIYKQDKIFYIGLSILFSLSEDFTIEKKMVRGGVIQILVRMLERNDFNLLTLSINFLSKMIIMTDNKNKMISYDLHIKLIRFFSCDNNDLLQGSLCLYRALALDKRGREVIYKEGIIPHIIEAFNNPPMRIHCINVLYLISTDHEQRSLFSLYNFIKPLVTMAIRFPQKYVGMELSALLINISSCHKNAVAIPEDLFKKALDRGLRSQDPRLLKFIKNVLSSGKQNTHYEVVSLSIKEITKLILKRNKNEFDQDVCFQLIGILAATNLGAEWDHLISEDLMEYLSRQISTINICEDDMLLELVMMVGNIAKCERVAEQLYDHGVLVGLASIFIEKMEDPQFCIQNIYTMIQFLRHGIGREMIIEEIELKDYLLEQLDSVIPEIRELADDLLDYVRNFDLAMSEDSKQIKFKGHNEQWLLKIEQMKMSGQLDMPVPYQSEMYLDDIWDSESDYD